MEINYDEIDSINEFQLVPEGTYLCRITEVKEAATRNGFPMWKLRLEIEEGDFAKRTILDRLIFSPPAMRRVKRALQCLGVEVAGKQDITPEMLLGKRCKIRTIVENYVDQEGESRTGNAVPYDGYQPADAVAGTSDERVPF